MYYLTINSTDKIDFNILLIPFGLFSFSMNCPGIFTHDTQYNEPSFGLQASHCALKVLSQRFAHSVNFTLQAKKSKATCTKQIPNTVVKCSDSALQSKVS